MNELFDYSDAYLEKKVNGFYNRIGKRVIGLCIAIPCFIILLPVFLVVSLAILFEDGLPVLYRAPRGGYKEKVFNICKFRSMVRNADKIGGYTTAFHDPRVTKVGAILRRTKLDETPQLINIIRGEMSFIGPRPEVLEYVRRFTGQERFILQVRPGITDYSSMKFINLDEIVGENNADEFFQQEILGQKNHLRLKYVSEISFWTDIRIFFQTIWRVIKKVFGQ